MKPDDAPDDPCAHAENMDEAELIQRAKRLPREFGPLYERYYDRILGYVYRRTLDAAVAEELTSSTFFRALRALPKYHDRGHFSAWLYRIAINEIRAHRRAASSRRESNHRWREELDRVCFVSQGPEAEEDVAERMQAFAQLHAALGRLPDRYQVVLSLRYFEAMPYAEIAEVLGRRLGTVRSLAHRGLKRLKREYRHEPQEEGLLP